MLMSRQQNGYATEDQLEALIAFADRELSVRPKELQIIAQSLFGATRLRLLLESEAKSLMFLLRERSGFPES